MSKKQRVRSKIDELPVELRCVVDGMLANVSYTYTEISDYLKESGHDISRGAVFRYAQRTNNAAQRIVEAQMKTKELIEAVKKNPEMDYTEGSLQIIASGLTSRLAGIQEEWDEMNIKDAAEVMIKLSRAKGYKDTVYSKLAKKVDLALSEFRSQVFEEIADKDPRLCNRLIEFAEEFAKTIKEKE